MRGQEYVEHWDAFAEPEEFDDANGDRRQIQTVFSNGGNRAWTALVYLNDQFSGGETAFPELDLEITPKTGRLLLFSNLHTEPRSGPVGTLHELSLHAGLPVLDGEKFAFNLWFRERAHVRGNRRALDCSKGDCVERKD